MKHSGASEVAIRPNCLSFDGKFIHIPAVSERCLTPGCDLLNVQLTDMSTPCQLVKIVASRLKSVPPSSEPDR